MKKKLVIFGADVMAKIIHFYFKRDSEYEVVGFTVNSSYIKENMFLGLPLVPFEEVTKIFPPSDYYLFIAIGPSKINGIREEKYNEAKSMGYTCASYISPYAVCQSEIGENVFIADGVVINPYVLIQNNNVFWEKAFVAHDVTIENHCYFSPNCSVGAFSSIKSNTTVGIGAVINTKVVLAEKSLIGASCYISKDTKPKGVYGRKGDSLLGCISDKIDISFKL